MRLLLISVLLALPVVGSATPAHACTSQIEPDGCAVINRACERWFGGDCLG